MAVLTMNDIRFGYGPQLVLDGVSLRVAPGQIVALTGPSGTGKTTLLHLAAGLRQPLSGEVVNRFRRVACIFQEPRLLPWRSALENIAYGLKAMGVTAPERRRRAMALAERLGLGGAVGLYPHQLSGGMRQRAALGRALAVEPDLLLMDEPFSALDMGLRRELQDLVLELLAERGLAALLVTHDLTEAVRMGDELLVIDGSPGRIVAHERIRRPGAQRGEQDLHQMVSTLLRRPSMASLARVQFR